MNGFKRIEKNPIKSERKILSGIQNCQKKQPCIQNIALRENIFMETIVKLFKLNENVITIGLFHRIQGRSQYYKLNSLFIIFNIYLIYSEFLNNM